MPKQSLAQWDPTLSHGTLRTYSGDQLRQRDPLRYEAVIRALKAGLTNKLTHELFGLSMETVAAIRKNENVAAHSDAELVNNLRHTVHVGSQKLLDAVESGVYDPEKLPVAIGILIDKIHQIEGKPTTIVRHERGKLSPDSLQVLIQKARDNVVDAEVVEDEQSSPSKPQALHSKCRADKGGRGSTGPGEAISSTETTTGSD